MRYLLLFFLVVTVKAQMPIPGYPTTNTPYWTNAHFYSHQHVITSLAWEKVENASDYKVYGSYDVTNMTNVLLTLQGNDITNCWFQGTNEYYFFRVSATLTNQ